MIKIYKADGALTTVTENYEDLQITKEINQLDKLNFRCQRELGVQTELEGFIETQFGKFTIKERHKSGRYEIIGELSLEDLDGIFIGKKFTNMTPKSMVQEILTTSSKTWLVSGPNESSVPSIDVPTSNIVDAIFHIVNELKLEVVFDQINKTIKIGKIVGADRGVYFHSDLNMENVDLNSDSYDFATRIMPIGKDGLTISSVNGGNPYLNAKDYYSQFNIPWNRRINKTVTKELIDERFTIPQNLKEYGIQKLEEMASTLRNVQCDVVDLSKNSDYEILAFDIGDKVEIIDEKLKMKEIQRIIKMVIYPYDITKNVVTFDNKPRSVNDRFDTIEKDVKDIKAEGNQAGQCILLNDSHFKDGNYTNSYRVSLSNITEIGMNENTCLIIPSTIKGVSSEHCLLHFHLNTPSIGDFTLKTESESQKILGLSLNSQEYSLKVIDISDLMYSYLSLKTYYAAEIKQGSINSSILGACSEYSMPTPGSYYAMFSNFSKKSPLTIGIDQGFENNITDMRSMFSDSSFKYLNMRAPNSVISTLQRAFSGSIISYLDLSGVNTTACQDYRYAFSDSIIDVLDVRSFDLSGVDLIRDRSMFSGAIIKKIIVPRDFELQFRELLQDAVSPETILITIG